MDLGRGKGNFPEVRFSSLAAQASGCLDSDSSPNLMPESSPGSAEQGGAGMASVFSCSALTCLGYTGKQAAGSRNHIPLTKKVKSTMTFPVFLPWPQRFVLHEAEMLQSNTEVIRANLAQHPSERKNNQRRPQHILKVLPIPLKS